MKVVKIICMLLFQASFLCCSHQKSAIIDIQVIGTQKSEKISVLKPINGFLVYDNAEILSLDESESAVLTIPLNDISPIRFSYAGHHSSILIEPQKTYHILIDFSDQGEVKFIVDDEIQKVYADLIATRDLYKYEHIRDYTQFPLDTMGAKMKANFDELIQRDKEKFVALTDKGMTKAIHNDIELFWMTTLAKVIRNNYIDNRAENMYDGYGEIWKDIYERYPIDANYIHTEWFYPYADIHLNYYIPFLNDGNTEIKTYEEYLNRYYDILYKNINDEKAREALLAKSIHYNLINNKHFDPAIIEHVTMFYGIYSDNRYRAIFQPYISEIEQYQQVIKEGFATGITIVDDYDNILSLKNAIALFEGKPVFIDFWFSSCGPCITQFKQSGPLKEFLKKNGIEMLYISIDSESLDKEWRNAIKYHNLIGNHIRTNEKMHTDLYENYGISMYPHYMLVDTNGNIVIPRCKQPSDGEELFKDIRIALGLS